MWSEDSHPPDECGPQSGTPPCGIAYSDCRSRFQGPTIWQRYGVTALPRAQSMAQCGDLRKIVWRRLSGDSRERRRGCIADAGGRLDCFLLPLISFGKPAIFCRLFMDRCWRDRPAPNRVRLANHYSFLRKVILLPTAESRNPGSRSFYERVGLNERELCFDRTRRDRR